MSKNEWQQQKQNLPRRESQNPSPLPVSLDNTQRGFRCVGNWKASPPGSPIHSGSVRMSGVKCSSGSRRSGATTTTPTMREPAVTPRGAFARPSHPRAPAPHSSLPESALLPKMFTDHGRELAAQIESTAQTASGRCCQWVLDDVGQTFEWLSATRVRLPLPSTVTRLSCSCLNDLMWARYHEFVWQTLSCTSSPDSVRAFAFQQTRM